MVYFYIMSFEAFDTKKIDEYARQAKESWGKTGNEMSAILIFQLPFISFPDTCIAIMEKSNHPVG